jgi:WD40 repeat protein
MIQFDGHTATVCSLAFSPDSALLASGAKDGWVRVWNPYGDSEGGICPNGGRPRVAVVWMPSGEWVTYTDANHLRSLGPFPASGNSWAQLQGFALEGISSLAYVTDSLLAVGTGRRDEPKPGCVYLRDAQRRKEVPVPMAIRGTHGVRAMYAHPPTKRLHWIAGLPNTTACVWRSWCITSANATDVKLNKPAADIAVSPDGATVAIASDWLVRVFAADGKPRTDLSGHKGQVAGVGFIHGGRTVVSASWDETVRFWDVATGTETARFPLTIGKLTALAVSPDGTRVAVGGTDGPIMVIDAE